MREKAGLSEACCWGLGERCWWAAPGQQVQEKEVNGCEIYLGAESTVFTGKSREREARQEWCLGSGLSTDRNVIPFIDIEKMGVEASVLDVWSSRCLWASWERTPRGSWMFEAALGWEIRTLRLLAQSYLRPLRCKWLLNRRMKRKKEKEPDSKTPRFSGEVGELVEKKRSWTQMDMWEKQEENEDSVEDRIR